MSHLAELSRGVVLVSKMILHNLFCVMLSLMVQMYKPQKHDILSTHILSIVSYIYGSSIVLKPRKKYGAKSNIYKWRKRWMVVASILPQIDAISFCLVEMVQQNAETRKFCWKSRRMPNIAVISMVNVDVCGSGLLHNGLKLVKRPI